MESELVDVKVPREHLTAVYGFIAQLEGSPKPSSEPSGSNGSAPDFGPWTPEKLRRAYAQSPAPLKAVLMHLAEHPDKVISTETLSQVYGKARGRPATPANLAGAIGAFGRRVANRYGIKGPKGRSVRPFNSWWDAGAGSVVYQMPEHIAEVIRPL